MAMQNPYAKYLYKQQRKTIKQKKRQVTKLGAFFY
jgi:translation initiation factor IF-3